MNESTAWESASDPPFPLFEIGVVIADSKWKKTIKHIAVNSRPPSIVQSAAIVFHVDATTVDRE